LPAEEQVGAVKNFWTFGRKVTRLVRKINTRGIDYHISLSPQLQLDALTLVDQMGNIFYSGVFEMTRGLAEKRP